MVWGERNTTDWVSLTNGDGKFLVPQITCSYNEDMCVCVCVLGQAWGTFIETLFW